MHVSNVPQRCAYPRERFLFVAELAADVFLLWRSLTARYHSTLLFRCCVEYLPVESPPDKAVVARHRPT